MGKIIKGVALYTLILIGILILIGAFIFGLMFFIPSFTPFGFAAINLNTNDETWSTLNLRESLTIDYDNGMSEVYGSEVKVYDVVVEAGDFNVKVISNPELTSFIRLRTSQHIFGLIRGDNAISLDTDLEIYQDQSISSGERYKLKVNMIYPTNGWINFKDSTLYLEVPADYAYNLTIQNTTGDIILASGEEDGNTTTLKIDTLDIETTTGSLNVEDLVASVDGEKNLTISSMSLKTSGGIFDFTDINTLNIMKDSSTTSTLVIDSNKGDFHFDTLRSAIIILGDDVSIKANTVITGGNPFTYRATNGFFDIGTINTGSDQLVSIITNNADIDIDIIKASNNTNGQQTSAIINTTYGDINIGTFYGKAKLATTHGSINVSLITAAISASTIYGDITLKYEGKASLTNINGAINAEFVVSSADPTNYTRVQNENGSVTLTNQVNNLTAIGIESATFNIRFNKLYFGDAFDSGTNTFAPATHSIIMRGSSTAYVEVPLAEYPIEITLVGDDVEEKANNIILSNLITGQTRITTDRVDENMIAGKLVSSTGDGCSMTLGASGGGSITLNTYNKDSLLTETTNSWFDLYVYTTDDPAVALFPIKYYYDETYRHEYSNSDDEEIDFRWTKTTLSDGNTKMATAMATINLRTVTEATVIVPNDVCVVFRSKLYSCGLFEQNENGTYKKVGDEYLLLTEDNLNSESGSYIDTDNRYTISDANTLTLPVITGGTNKTITFYVASDFDGSTAYVKMTLTLISE